MAEIEGSRFQRVLDELRQTQTALAEAEKRLSTATYTGRSKDRAVEITVGAQGQLTRVKFLADKYRSMTAEQLGAAVLEAAQRGRAHMAESVMGAFRPVTDQAAALREERGAGDALDWDKVFAPFEQAVSEGSATRTKKKSKLRDEIVEDDTADTPAGTAPADGNGGGFHA
ncbi:YbaB/EbfC family nucleoid-associated protein [Streptomyces sp. R1]|uniref:YbaB/EbfC family nucleoid-associated protein n=1 Tax=Streptomyces sp. R1 TaxID=1509279 RepID=UPI001E2B0723|nr:YbaB/EbfC family nucleoid-associated protein [Streptomyces sp. R1]MCC8338955.1 YbaB/EbfC family nucleoid-associated protein [Streptomyces sp. R1]